MTDDGPDDALTQAGTGLLFLVRKLGHGDGSDVTDIDEDGCKRLLAEVRLQLGRATPKQDPHRYAATKEALEALEAKMRGETPLGQNALFRAHVEAIHGGAREINFAGVTIKNKPSAEQAFLRAATVALWEAFPADRDTLVKEAKKHLGINGEQRVRKLVENFYARHDVEVHKSRSPLSVHIARVRELIKGKGYRSLSDFL